MTLRAARPGVCGVLAGLWLIGAVAAPARAQFPHGTPPGLAKHGGKPPGKSGSGGPTSTDLPGGGAGGGATSRVRSLGVWLDDATVMAPGESWLTLSMQRWDSPSGTGIDAPIVDLAGGVAHNVQPFLSTAYSQITYTGTPAQGELGTVYLGAKIGLRDPASGSFGFSVSPAVEILSDSASTGTGLSRVNFVLPASMEWRRSATRVYGSTGYFTRGAFFLGGAVEQTVVEHWVLTGALTQAWSTDSAALSDQLGLNSTRTDLSGSVSWIGPHVMLFGSAARTISQLDADATRYSFAVGASINLNHPGRKTPVAKP